MSIFKKLSLLVLIPISVWVGSIGVAEIAFRFLGIQSGTNLAIYIPFGEGGFRVKPETYSVQNWFSGFFSIKTDGNGMRCGRNGRWCLDSGSRFDLLAFGDSQAFGQGVEYEDSIIGVIAREASGQNMLVANASVGGHLLLNQLELAKSIDVEQTKHLKKTLIFLTPRSIGNPGGYTRVHVTEDGQLFDSPPTMVTLVRTWLRTHTAVYVVVRDAFKSVFSDEASSNYVLSLYAVSSVNDKRVEQLHDVLGEFEGWARSRNSELLIVYLPLLLEFEFDRFLSPAQKNGGKYSSETPFLIAAEAAEKLGVSFIDTREMLQEAALRGVVLQLSGDSHYNATASRIVGEGIWESMQTLK